MRLLAQGGEITGLVLNAVIFVIGWLLKSPLKGGRRKTDRI